jgi:PhnB protein
MEVSPYLFFGGACEEALKFYEKTLGAKIDAVMKTEGSPAEYQMPPNWKDKVMHARFRIGGHVVMASDAPPDHYRAPQGFSLSLSYPDVAEAEDIYNKLAEGGSVQMPFSPTFWAKGFGMCVDRFGIPWMVSCEGEHE